MPRGLSVSVCQGAVRRLGDNGTGSVSCLPTVKRLSGYRTGRRADRPGSERWVAGHGLHRQVEAEAEDQECGEERDGPAGPAER